MQKNKLETKIREVFKLLKNENTSDVNIILNQCIFNLKKASTVTETDKLEIEISGRNYSF